VKKINSINKFFIKINFFIKNSCQELKTKEKEKSKLITPKLSSSHDFILANLVLLKIP
jgi:hypothetical protein